MSVININNMDIYSFINSKDIGDYCRKIGHKFNPIEAAYLIWRSERRTLEERHRAWKELIETTPDMPIPNSGYDSLHDFLDSYIKAENDYLERFYKNDDNAVYSFWVHNDFGKVNLLPFESVYKTVDDCLEHLQWWKEHDNICSLGVSKILLDSHRKFEDGMEIAMSYDFKPLRITDRNVNRDLYITFCKLCPIVPTPFRKGDIVRLFKDRHHESIANEKKKAVFVLDTIGYWSVNDSQQDLKKSDNYNAIVYYIEDENSGIAYSQVPYFSDCENEVETWGWKNNYLDLEYYQGEPKSYERILTSISNCLKGNNNLSHIMNNYDKQDTAIKEKDSVAEKLKFIAHKLTYTTRIMKRNDEKAIENIILCEALLKEILEENTENREGASGNE